MYAAKAHGKGHAQVFAPEMLRAARRRMRIENELADALDLNQLEAHYQPIVDLTSRQLVGVEALVRWRHPTRGLVRPGEFVPLAEETGQIVPMTRWMLEQACGDLVRMQRALARGHGLRVAVNISSRYLNQGDIVDDVRTVLAAHEVLPECLILEVTESLLLENSARIERIFRELKAIGVRRRARRFWHWLLVAGVPAPLPDRHPQDRSLVRTAAAARGRRAGKRGRNRSRESHPVSGRGTRTRDGRGRHRGRSPASDAAGARLLDRAGACVRRGHATCRAHRNAEWLAGYEENSWCCGCQRRAPRGRLTARAICQAGPCTAAERAHLT